MLPPLPGLTWSPIVPSIGPVDESFSIEFWVRRNGAVTGDNQVAIGRTGGGPTWWVGIGGDNDPTVNQNAAVFFLGDNNGGATTTLKGTTDITDDDWHHVVAVRDRSLGANGQNPLICGWSRGIN